MRKDTSDPAFPSPEIRSADGCGIARPEYGISQRQWFAGRALPGVIVTCAGDTGGVDETREEMFARKAYAIADAMIAEGSRED